MVLPTTRSVTKSVFVPSMVVTLLAVVYPAIVLPVFTTSASIGIQFEPPSFVYSRSTFGIVPVVIQMVVVGVRTA